jgi:hypothetical protein
MIDLKIWDAEDKKFRAYVRTTREPKDRVLSRICAHYELESDEMMTADRKARDIYRQERGGR